MKFVNAKLKKMPFGLRSRHAALLIFGLLIQLLIAACGGNTPSTAPASATSASDSSSNGQSTATEPGAAAETNPALNTEEFGLSKQGLVESIEKVESLIAQCMNAAGFEYVAVDYDTVRRGMSADKTLAGVSDEDFIAQYGYGISTLYTGLAPQFSTTETAAKIGLGEQNVQIFNKLATADQVAYSRTLLGQNSEATFAVALENEDFSRTGGCTRTAIEQVFSEDQLKATYYNPLDSRIEQDPRMLAALTEFADCVHKEGFNYNHPDEAERDIKTRLDAITNGAPIDTLSSDAKAALNDLQGEERAVAQIVTTCAEEIVEPVKAKLEQEFSK